ncbi:MAG TPA: RiPP maturation radical SAM C-methyltransferase [Polyangia bacterium]|nr:RiPP maturation radical SAM C-methyltransferase [Polyangia bacterium]
MDPVVLVTMPFDLVTQPSIQIGTVKAILARAGIPSVAKYFNVALTQFLADELGVDGGIDQYDLISYYGHNRMVGDWIFRLPSLFGDDVRKADDDYLAYLAARHWQADRVVPAARALRERAPEFLARCADDVLAHQPRVVGFTLMFGQTTASAALAQALKARDPSLRIVFGGACVQGAMGKAVFRMFPFVDVVVRGEAEELAPYVFRKLLDGAPLEERPGLCARDGERAFVAAEDAGNSAMADVPQPIYDEYFEYLHSHPVGARLFREAYLVIEAARGCWWGEKQHCTFCGLNGTSLEYRSKPAEQVLEEIVALSRRHHVHRFYATDNIFELKYFETLLPRLTALGFDFEFLLETKVNLDKEQITALKRSGVERVQGGVESLSTKVLKLMKKGSTALQNIRFLKWCQELDIAAEWNFLFGFPGEPIEEYDRMAAQIPNLIHLSPPSGNPYCIRIDRFAPYHSRPADFAITLKGPLPHYAMIYPSLDAQTLEDCAYSFAFEYDRPDDPRKYAGKLIAEVHKWREAWQSGARPTLRQYRGPGFVRIVDRRRAEQVVHTLTGADAALYLACDAGVRLEPARAQAERDGHPLTPADARARLDAMVAAGLIFEEDGRYLSLAVAARPREPVDAEAREPAPAAAAPLYSLRARPS